MYVSKCNWKSVKSMSVCVQKRYRAIYDYAAADEDEVSFADGDVIVDVQQIDEGWMFGRVERTGQQGMLPANYVEAIWVSVAERRRMQGGRDVHWNDPGAISILPFLLPI